MVEGITLIGFCNLAYHFDYDLFFHELRATLLNLHLFLSHGLKRTNIAVRAYVRMCVSVCVCLCVCVRACVHTCVRKKMAFLDSRHHDFIVSEAYLFF